MNTETELDEWPILGSTSNAQFRLIDENIIAVIPFPNADDTAETARESVRFQSRYWTDRGHPGAALIFVDRVLMQDAGARSVYMHEPDPRLSTCYALISATGFGVAVSAVYLGLTPPPVPTRCFATVLEALSWVRTQNAERGVPGRT